MSDQMRKEFEAWASTQGLRVDRALSAAGADLKRYDFELTNAAFEIWQASRAALVVELPKVYQDPYADSYTRANIDGKIGLLEEVQEALDEAGVSYK